MISDICGCAMCMRDREEMDRDLAEMNPLLKLINQLWDPEAEIDRSMRRKRDANLRAWLRAHGWEC
jgi:hypothetical protein